MTIKSAVTLMETQHPGGPVNLLPPFRCNAMKHVEVKDDLLLACNLLRHARFGVKLFN